MAAAASGKAGAARTVRLDAPTRDRLDVLAAASDRTLAQLIRYALLAYFTSGPSCPVPGLPEEREDAGTRHATLRLPADLEAKVEAHAARCEVTYSDVVRHAVALWLDTADPAMLGAPALGGGGSR